MNIVRFYIIIFVQINLVIKKNIINKYVELTNSFNKLLFVIQDKEALLKNISNKGYNINHGPQ